MTAYIVNNGTGDGEPTAWRGCSSLWGALASDGAKLSGTGGLV